MSKWRIGIAIVVLTTQLSSTAQARGLGPLGAVRSVFAHVLPLGGLHRHRALAHRGHVREADLRSQEARSAHDAGNATESARPPDDPAARRQIAAAAALAAWHGGHVANGWWRHADGGYGWIGPLFWPFAYDDIYGYAMRADGISFWDYGYPDIHAGIFGPYGPDDLAAYSGPGRSGRRHPNVPSLTQLCGDDGHENSPSVDQIRDAVQPNEAQRAALDDLAKALISAAHMIRVSCPAQPAFTAPDRLAVMQQRIDAMVHAELALQQPLEKFYDLLTGEQKAKLNARAGDQLKTSVTNRDAEASAQTCDARPAALQWPADEIEARLHPNDSQRAALKALRHASSRAVDILNDECQPKDATTPTGRLYAVDDRLNAMQQALNLVSAALQDFYATLSDEQKAQFEAIGQKQVT
jgi:hypothetical protein